MSFYQARSPIYAHLYANLGETSLNWQMSFATASKTTVPSVGYSITKSVPVNSVSYVLDISPFTREYFVHEPVVQTVQGVYDSHEGLIVRHRYSIYDQVPSLVGSGTFDCMEGYSLFSDGYNSKNPADAVQVFLTNDYYVIDRDRGFVIGVGNDGTHDKVEVDGTPYSLNNIPDNLGNLVQQLWVIPSPSALDGDIITVEVFDAAGTAVLKTIYLEVRSECKYTPTHVLFLNRWGNYQLQTFFKSNQQTLTTKSEQGINNLLDLSIDAVTFDTEKHQMARFNTGAQLSITMNSGYLPESSNETIQELLLSEYVYIVNADDSLTPINIKDTSKTFSTRVNDKVINHTVTAEYAYSQINRV